MLGRADVRARRSVRAATCAGHFAHLFELRHRALHVAPTYRHHPHCKQEHTITGWQPPLKGCRQRVTMAGNTGVASASPRARRQHPLSFGANTSTADGRVHWWRGSSASAASKQRKAGSGFSPWHGQRGMFRHRQRNDTYLRPRWLPARLPDGSLRWTSSTSACLPMILPARAKEHR